MSKPEPECDLVKVWIVSETPKAVLLESEGQQDWFPLSEVSFDSRKSNGEAVAKIPLWLLEKKGWD